MSRDFRIVFEEDGFPRELVTAAEQERAVRDELLTADTQVTVYRTGAAPLVTKVGEIAELQPLFKVDEPKPDPATLPPPTPVSQPPAGDGGSEVAASVPGPAEAAAAPPSPAPLSWEFADAEVEDDPLTPGTSFNPGPGKTVGLFVVAGIFLLLMVIGVASNRRTPIASRDNSAALAASPVDNGTVTAPPLPTGPAPVSAEEMGASMIRYTVRLTNIRAGPDRYSNVIASLSRGEIVQGVSVPSRSDPNFTWLKITHGDHAGYFVSEPNLSANARPTLDTSASGQWTVYQEASVYGEPSTNSAVLGTASPNQIFTVFGITEGGMMEVSREGGGIGYIQRSAFDRPIDGDQGMSNTAVGEGYDELSMWEHNGGLLRLRASGQRRMFVYSQPRAGVPAARGDVLFHGERRGSVYLGTAYLFSTQCGRIGFRVEGYVGPDDRQVALHGNAPRRDRSCRVIGNRPEQLQFRYVRHR